MVKIVETLFVIDASEDTIAATKAAKIIPLRPTGISVIRLGYAWSGLAKSGTISTAAIPGNTTIKGISSFRKAANAIPFCAS